MTDKEESVADFFQSDRYSAEACIKVITKLLPEDERANKLNKAADTLAAELSECKPVAALLGSISSGKSEIGNRLIGAGNILVSSQERQSCVFVSVQPNTNPTFADFKFDGRRVSVAEISDELRRRPDEGAHLDAAALRTCRKVMLPGSHSTSPFWSSVKAVLDPPGDSELAGEVDVVTARRLVLSNEDYFTVLVVRADQLATDMALPRIVEEARESEKRGGEHFVVVFSQFDCLADEVLREKAGEADAETKARETLEGIVRRAFEDIRAECPAAVAVPTWFGKDGTMSDACERQLRTVVEAVAALESRQRLHAPLAEFAADGTLSVFPGGAAEAARKCKEVGEVEKKAAEIVDELRSVVRAMVHDRKGKWMRELDQRLKDKDAEESSFDAADAYTDLALAVQNDNDAARRGIEDDVHDILNADLHNLIADRLAPLATRINGYVGPSARGTQFTSEAHAALVEKLGEFQFDPRTAVNLDQLEVSDVPDLPVPASDAGAVPFFEEALRRYKKAQVGPALDAYCDAVTSTVMDEVAAAVGLPADGEAEDGSAMAAARGRSKVLFEFLDFRCAMVDEELRKDLAGRRARLEGLVSDGLTVALDECLPRPPTAAEPRTALPSGVPSAAESREASVFG